MRHGGSETFGVLAGDDNWEQETDLPPTEKLDRASSSSISGLSIAW